MTWVGYTTPDYGCGDKPCERVVEFDADITLDDTAGREIVRDLEHDFDANPKNRLNHTLKMG